MDIYTLPLFILSRIHSNLYCLQKPWVIPFRKSTILQDLPAAIEAALQVVETVVWLQGTPTRDEADQKQISNSEVDNLMRDVLCNSAHAGSIRVFRNSSDSHSTSKVMRTCIYVPFPTDLLSLLFEHPEDYYHDNFHFSDSSIYLRRNAGALEAAGVKLPASTSSFGRSIPPPYPRQPPLQIVDDTAEQKKLQRRAAPRPPPSLRNRTIVGNHKRTIVPSKPIITKASAPPPLVLHLP